MSSPSLKSTGSNNPFIISGYHIPSIPYILFSYLFCLLIAIRQFIGTLSQLCFCPLCVPIFRLAGSEEEDEEGEWRLYFKLYCFLDVESMPKEGVEFAFMFEQVSSPEHDTKCCALSSLKQKPLGCILDGLYVCLSLNPPVSPLGPRVFDQRPFPGL